MTQFETQLINALSEIKGSGSFLSADNQPFAFPGLEIKGMDEVAFPLNTLQIKELIKYAHKAPFGKGAETILDTTVRSAWEIDASEISFNNPDWKKFIAKITEDIKPDLGIENHTISANLYKLLIYEEGDFFLAHKDSEKEKGMFGTLIVGLPSKHTGGELLVRFDGMEVSVDFSELAGQYKMPYVAFYADCEHEIKPITSGYRVCLVYNLVQTKGKEKILLEPLSQHIEDLSKILKTCEEDNDIPKIVLLGHQYTPSNFTMEGLKLNDRPKAEALMAAAEKIGFYAKLGLVTSYQSGSLEYTAKRSSRRRSYYDDEYESDEELTENGTMGEIYDEYLTIEHWMEEGIPPLQGLEFEENDLIKDFNLHEGEPDEKEAEGWTGNAGMEMQYWYHYGAVFLWPKKYHADLVTVTPKSNQLEWIDYYNGIWKNADDSEKKIAKELIGQISGIEAGSREKLSYDAIASFLINLRDESYMTEKGTDLLAFHFQNIAVNQWIDLFRTYQIEHFEKIFTNVISQQKVSFIKHLSSILLALREADLQKFGSFINQYVEQIPDILRNLKLSDEKKHGNVSVIVSNVIKLSVDKNEDEAWLRDTKIVFTRVLNRKYVNETLVGTIFKDKLTNWALAKELLLSCGEDLSNRVDNKPQPPENWTRAIPNAGKSYQKEWNILAEFLASPTQQVFMYAKVQSDRSAMESAIRNVTIDLDMETIRKGSPHTLKLTKNQANYDREMVLWNKDVALLREVERIIGDD
jgi:2OG-Fe(II) oxygenase superfamily